MTKIACGAALALLGLVGSACGGGPCGDAEDRPVPLTDLPCSMTDAGGVWYSHPFPPISDAQCYWLEFRGCSQYQIEHPLGRAPVNVLGYTSFDPKGWNGYLAQCPPVHPGSLRDRTARVHWACGTV